MISAIKTRFKKKNHKYGIQVPHTIKEAYLIDKETGTDVSIHAQERSRELYKVPREGAPDHPVCTNQATRNRAPA
jgi:hypothetical protein